MLSSADPVSVVEDFTLVDLLSGGRAEIMAGRGAFAESFPLYGFRLGDSDRRSHGFPARNRATIRQQPAGARGFLGRPDARTSHPW